MNNTARILPQLSRNFESIGSLQELTGDQLLSVYIPILENDTKVDIQIRLNSLLEKPRKELIDSKGELEAQKYCIEIRKFIQNTDISDFREGLALFKKENAFYSYHLEVKPPEFAMINTRFFLQPLQNSLQVWEDYRIITIEDSYLTLHAFDHNQVYPIKKFNLKKNISKDTTSSLRDFSSKPTCSISKSEAKSIAFQLVFDIDIDSKKVILLGSNADRYYFENALKSYAMIDICMKGDYDCNILEIRQQIIESLTPQNELFLAQKFNLEMEA